MLVSNLLKEDLTKDIVDKLLFRGLSSTVQNADCAMVLGSSKATIYRLPVAVDLYNRGIVPKLLFSGGRMVNNVTEAQSMKNRALELGVNDKDIILEELSLTTKENIICSLLPLERHFKLSDIANIILITTTYHMRRSIMFAKAYSPDWINFIPCPADDTNTRKDNWWKSDKGYERAVNEAWRIICYIKEGSLPDFAI